MEWRPIADWAADYIWDLWAKVNWSAQVVNLLGPAQQLKRRGMVCCGSLCCKVVRYVLHSVVGLGNGRGWRWVASHFPGTLFPKFVNGRLSIFEKVTVCGNC